MGKYKLHNNIINFLLSLLLLSSMVLRGQSSLIDSFYPKNDFTAHHNFKHWSTANGLPQNSIRSIVQTKDGFLWLATQGGLVRFDGTDFTVFDVNKYHNLGGNRIMQLAADSVGGLWILGEDSHIVYLKENKFKDYTTYIKEKLKTQDNINTEVIFSFVLQTDSLLLLLTESKLISFNFKKASILFQNSNDRILNVLEDHNKNIILITKKRNYISINGKFIHAEKTFKSGITFLTEDRFGNYITVEKIKHSSSSYKTKVILPNKSYYFKKFVNKVYCDNYNRKWISVGENGLWLIDNDLNLQKINYDFFNKSKIISMFNDKQGNIWIGTNISGLFKIEAKTLYPISLRNGIFNDIIYPILKDKHNVIWLGSACGGIARIKNGTVTYFAKELNNSDVDCIYSLYETKDGKILAGGQRNGVMEFTKNRFIKKHYSPTLDRQSIFTIFEQSDKTLWFGTTEGVFIYRDGKIKTYSVINSSLPGQRVSAITEDKKGIIWFATNKGLAYFKNGKFSAIHFTNEASPNYVRSIYIDKNNNMWLGTYGGGLVYLKNGNFKIISKADGLFDNYIHATVEDKNGYFWMSTNHGIFRTKKSQLLDFVHGKINKVDYTLITKNAQLPSNEFNGGIQPQYCIPDSETILFPSFGGAIAVNLYSSKMPNNPPKVFIEYFSVDDKTIKNSDEYIVPKDYSDIKIKFTSIAFNNPDGIFFKYKLEPLDKTWKNINNKRMVEFNHLPPGNYKFKVTAYNFEKTHNNQISSLDFVVQANFYQEKWFKILIILFLFTAISLFYLLRLKLAKKREIKLNEIIKQRTKSLSVALENANSAKKNEAKQRKKAEHLNNEKSELLRIVSHDLKNPIGVIKSAAELIDSEIEDTEIVKEMAKIIKDSSTRMLNSVQELLHMSELDDENFSLNRANFDFIPLVRETINRNLHVATSKGQTITISTALSQISVYADYDKLTSCVDNYLSNAIKYSPKNSKIEITIESDGENLIFKVKDYGVGLTEEDLKHVFGKFKKLSARPTAGESSSGLGLSIVKKILELHGGKVGVESQYQKGSLFFFVLPLPKNTSEK